jgi:hypothetical protein
MLLNMRHSREEVVERTIREFKLLDQRIAGLSNEDWNRPLLRPEGEDPWTIKDAVVHITYWKADVARIARKRRRPPEVRGLRMNDHNHFVYDQWRHRSPRDVLIWHRQVQEDVLLALREAPDSWFSGKKRKPWWPFDLDGHSTQHRTSDIERALAAGKG